MDIILHGHYFTWTLFYIVYLVLLTQIHTYFYFQELYVTSTASDQKHKLIYHWPVC